MNPEMLFGIITAQLLKIFLLLTSIWYLFSCFIAVPCSGNHHKVDILDIESARYEIEADFKKLVNQLEEKKTELLRELDEIENKYLKEQQETDDMIRILEDGLEYSSNIYGDSEFVKSINERHVKDTQIKLKELKVHRRKSILLTLDNIEFQKMLQEFGKIELIQQIRYQDKQNPVIQAGKNLLRDGEWYPYDVAIHAQSNNIFVAVGNGKVQVFDPNGKYLFKFGEIGLGKSKAPVGVVIFDEKVYVSQMDQGVNIYDIKGNYIGEFGNTGVRSETISNPRGLTISEEDGDIYVCDWGENHISVYSKDLKYKTKFGKGLFAPRDIAITQERIYVLDEQNPCIHIFNRDHSYSQSIVSRGTNNQVGHSVGFTIDEEDNILIPDHKRNKISVFTQEGELIHEIGMGSDYLDNPTGIAIDGMNRIIVVDSNQEGPLKIF